MINQESYGIFDMLNERFFNGKLPTIPIFEVCNADVNWHGCHLERTNEYGDIHYRILINTCGISTSSHYLGIMAHEMVHHWQIVNKIPGKDHGKRFRKKAKKISKVLGISVLQPIKVNEWGKIDTEEHGLMKEYLEIEGFGYDD